MMVRGDRETDFQNRDREQKMQKALGGEKSSPAAASAGKGGTEAAISGGTAKKSAPPRVERLTIETEYIRLQDALKLSGAAETGGQAKLAVQAGLVEVNGETCLQRGKKLRPGDEARFGEVLCRVEAMIGPKSQEKPESGETGP